MHQIEDLANFVRIGEIPQNVNIGQGLGKWPENRNQEIIIFFRKHVVPRREYTVNKHDSKINSMQTRV
jgi:hypothetical protein